MTEALDALAARVNALEALVAQWQALHQQTHELEERARDIAARDITRRLMDMNELRQQIEVERRGYLQKEQYDRDHTALRDSVFTRIDQLRDGTDARLKAIETYNANFQGKFWMMGAVISAVVVLLNLATRFWK